MDIKRLNYFRQIARAGSISKAANQLALSQPALSQQLALLERELDTVLVERVSGGIKLTQPGLKLLEQASELLDSFDNLKASLSAENFVAEQLSIAAGGTASAAILPRGLALFSKKYPQIKLNLLETDNEQVKLAVKSGQVDLAILSGEMNDGAIHSEFLFSDFIVPVVAKNHALAKAKQATPKNIIKAGLLLYHQDSVIRQITNQLFAGYDYENDIRMQLRSVQSLIKCAEAGLGVGFVSRLSLTNNLVELKNKNFCQERSFYLCSRQSSYNRLSKLAKELQDCLQKVVV